MITSVGAEKYIRNENTKRLHYLLILTRFQCTKLIFFLLLLLTRLPSSSSCASLPFFFSSALLFCVFEIIHSLFTQFQSPESTNDRLFVFFLSFFLRSFILLPFDYSLFSFSRKKRTLRNTGEHVWKSRIVLRHKSAEPICALLLLPYSLSSKRLTEELEWSDLFSINLEIILNTELTRSQVG